MLLDVKVLFKSSSPRIVAKALATLDKSTAMVVSSCWLVAVVALVLAVFAVHTAVSAKKEAAEALAVEPVLPKITNTPISQREILALVERLKHQFPDIRFDVGSNQAIYVRCNDGAKFHQWITAMSFIDSMDPQYRWSMPELCVGSCGQDIMRGMISGQKVVFELPPH